MTDLSPEVLASLRDTATNATPGPWVVSPIGVTTEPAPDQSRTVVARFAANANAAHIAAFDPPMVLALLDLIQAQADTIQRVEAVLGDWRDHGPVTDGEVTVSTLRDLMVEVRAALGGDAR